MVKNSLTASFLLIVCILLQQARGQELPFNRHADGYLRSGMELYEKGNYVSAQEHFMSAADAFDPWDLHRKGEAEFFVALCAIELFNQDAEYLIRSFIDNYPDNQRVNQAFFELGKLRYREQKYTDAIYWLSKANRNALAPDQRAELLFKLGYSQFSLGDTESASRAFFEIKDTRNRYASPATYYYSHIAYEQGNYATALRGFQTLADDPTFSTLVPYYISQILFLQREFQKAVDYATPILESASARRAPEISRIIGESLYRLNRFDEALPYIEKYIEKAQTLTREDNYLIGFVYYRNQQFEEAAKYLERVPTQEDHLSQNAYYHLAECYLRMDEKAKARQAFAMASKTDFDPNIKEDALFNFAKITYETLYNPFNEAIDAFNRYIELYPNSPRADEAYAYLMQAYSSTRNYRNALESLNQIRTKDASIKRAYQRVAFFRGIELFQNLQFEEAAKTLTLSLQYPEYDRTLSALGLYWRGESFFRLEEYPRASDDFTNFLLSPGAFDQPQYRMAHYNLGYTHFKLRNYDDAIVWFRKFTSTSQNQPDQFLGDAYNRIGDSYFIQRRYWVAIDYYDNAIRINTIDIDYALFQRGISYGLVERPQRKIEALNELIGKHPNSRFMDDALFELGESHHSLNQTDLAFKNYQLIERHYPGSPYYARALVQLGLIDYNRDSLENALNHYRRVVEGFPGSDEAKNALVGIRNIYVDLGNVQTYFDYAATLGSLGNVSLAEKDSLQYIAAERLYMGGETAKAKESLKQYLQEFPKGNFVINAHHYLGDSQLRLGNTEEALASFSQVIQYKKNPFTESSLLAAASIYHKEGQYANAYQTYSLLEDLADTKANLLEARLGMLRTATQLNEPNEVIAAAGKVLITEKLPTELESEARIHRADALMEVGKPNEAFDEYARLSDKPRTKEGARSKYQMISILKEKGELDQAQKEIFNFAQSNTSHQYWLAKSFILLADIYAERNDFFQAKATLQSVLDGYHLKDDGIVDLAEVQLQKLVEEEKEKQQVDDDDADRVEWTF